MAEQLEQAYEASADAVWDAVVDAARAAFAAGLSLDPRARAVRVEAGPVEEPSEPWQELFVQTLEVHVTPLRRRSCRLALHARPRLGSAEDPAAQRQLIDRFQAQFTKRCRFRPGSAAASAAADKEPSLAQAVAMVVIGVTVLVLIHRYWR